jgi:thiol-disulfide isomerase/thioredoxin
MDKTIKIAVVILVAVILGGAILFVSPLLKPAPPTSGNEISDAGKVTVYFFYGEECPHCHTVMPFIRNLSDKYPEVDLQMLETWHNETNQVFSLALHQKLGIKSAGVPEVIVGTVVLTGSVDIPANLESVITEELKKNR